VRVPLEAALERNCAGASLGFPPRTSAWLARKVTPRTTLMANKLGNTCLPWMTQRALLILAAAFWRKVKRVQLEAALERNGARTIPVDSAPYQRTIDKPRQKA